MKKQLAKHLNDSIERIEEIHNGLLSQGYKVVGKNATYFARKVKDVGGYEYIGDDARSFLISDYMYQNAENSIKSYGVIPTETGYLHLQEFKQGSSLASTQYSHSLLEQVATKLGTLHVQGKEKVQQYSDKKKIQLYTRGYREIITNHETLFSLYENHIQGKEQQQYFQQQVHDMLDVYFTHCKRAKGERLTTLHGDFHDGNIFLDTNEDVHLFDFSRTPYGDPGIDLGTYLANLEIKELLGEIEQGLSERFLKKYIAVTDDPGVTNHLSLSKLRVVFLLGSPLLQNFLNRNSQQKQEVEQYRKNILANR